MAEDVDQIRLAFGQQLSTLRTLLQAGARESTFFRARLANYHAFLVALTDLFQSALDLERRRQDESPVLVNLRDELEAVNEAILEEFAILTQPRLRHEKLPPSHLKERYALGRESERGSGWAREAVSHFADSRRHGVFGPLFGNSRGLCRPGGYPQRSGGFA